MSAAGSVRNADVPRPISLSSDNVPSCARTMPCAIARPRPAPERSVRLLCQNRSKTNGRSSAAIPAPVSCTTTSTPFGCRNARIFTCPPSGVNLTAFPTRFESTCAIRSGLMLTSGSPASSSVSSVTPRDRASGASRSAVVAINAPIASGRRTMRNLPRSSCVTSSRS